jgi:methyl-accepting chemotaxis protein
MAQIERSAEASQGLARDTVGQIVMVADVAADAGARVAALAGGVDLALGISRVALGDLAALGEGARQIEKITDALALVAVQTSMLAVSGAVEATRAGEAGRGFATVAGDIRKLSRASAANAEQARDTVRQIQDALQEARRDLDQIVGASEGELARTRALATRFAGINEDLAIAREAGEVIAQGAGDMFRAVREIQHGTQQIAAAAEQAAGAVLQAGGAARQQAQAAEELAAAIEDIAGLTATLVEQGG